MQVVIVSGTTSTGKTAIARKIAKQLGYELLSKDNHKENLFKTHNARAGLASWNYFETESLRQFYAKLAENVKNNHSVVIESNFHRQDKSILNKLIKDLDYKEIYCQARGFTIIMRYIKRNERGERHPAHLDRLWYLPVVLTNIYSPLVRRRNPPMSPDNNHLLRLDTTHFDKINMSTIYSFIKDPSDDKTRNNN